MDFLAFPGLSVGRNVEVRLRSMTEVFDTLVQGAWRHAVDHFQTLLNVVSTTVPNRSIPIASRALAYCV